MQGRPPAVMVAGAAGLPDGLLDWLDGAGDIEVGAVGGSEETEVPGVPVVVVAGLVPSSAALIRPSTAARTAAGLIWVTSPSELVMFWPVGIVVNLTFPLFSPAIWAANVVMFQP